MFYSNVAQYRALFKQKSAGKNTLHKFAEGSLEEEDGTPVDNLLRKDLVNC